MNKTNNSMQYCLYKFGFKIILNIKNIKIKTKNNDILGILHTNNNHHNQHNIHNYKDIIQMNNIFNVNCRKLNNLNSSHHCKFHLKNIKLILFNQL